jgi:hypothetical protein
MAEFHPGADKSFLRARLGDMSQLAGVRHSFLMDGRARMVEALDFDNGSGLQFTVLPGRGMDIAWAKYRGIPLCFMTKAGVASPESYDPEGMGWLWNFFGGLLTTCGLSNVGDPCEDERPELGPVHHGLHGRLSGTAAANVGWSAAWVDGAYRLNATGQMREGVLHGQNLSLTRTIETRLGENALYLTDVIENEGFTPEEVMILYHINIGYPVLDASSRLMLPEGTQTSVSNSGAMDDPAACGRFSAPSPDAPQHVYLHEFPRRADGLAEVGIYNPEIALGVALSYDPGQLPYFNQWKRMSAGDYVVGLEPANCRAIGRARMRKQGGLETLGPGETRTIRWKLSILDGEAQCAALAARLKG